MLRKRHTIRPARNAWSRIYEIAGFFIWGQEIRSISPGICPARVAGMEENLKNVRYFPPGAINPSQ
jgi:hypothetical protein